MTDTSANLLADLVERNVITVEQALELAGSHQVEATATPEEPAAQPDDDTISVAEAVELYPVEVGSKYFPKYPTKIASQAQSRMVYALTGQETWLQEHEDVNRLEAGSIINALLDGTSVRLEDGTSLVPDPQ